MDREQALSQGLNMFPQSVADFFQYRQPSPPVCQVKPQCNHEGRSDQVSRQWTWSYIQPRNPRAEQAGHGADQHIAADTPKIVSQLVYEGIWFFLE